MVSSKRTQYTAFPNNLDISLTLPMSTNASFDLDIAFTLTSNCMKLDNDWTCETRSSQSGSYLLATVHHKL